MTSKGLLESWLNFLFTPQSPIPIALFRIFLGILLLETAFIHIGKDFLTWYGPESVTNFDTVRTYWWNNQPHFDLFLLLPHTDAGALTLWSIFITATIMMTVGLFARASTIVVAMCLVSMHNHQPFNINGGDAMLRLYTGYLIFSDSGAAFSLERLINRFRFPTFGNDSAPKMVAPLGLRMIQIQLAISYWSTFTHKISGAQWLDGTAVYYSTRLDDLVRHPMPLLYNNMLFCKLLTWFTLLVEGSMFTLVWLRELRYWVLLAAVALHLGIDYSINLPVFEWAFIAGFITFIYPEDLTKSMDAVKNRIVLSFGPAEPLRYSPAISRQASWASVLEGIDILGRLAISPDDKVPSLTADTKFGVLNGLKLFAWLTCRIPLLWIMYPVAGLPFQLLNQSSAESATTHKIED